MLSLLLDIIDIKKLKQMWGISRGKITLLPYIIYIKLLR